MIKLFRVSGLFVLVNLAAFAGLFSQVDYKTKVEPVWSKYGCVGCHGGSGGLFINTYKNLMSTGNHKPLVKPYDTNSILVQKLNGSAAFGDRMPPGGQHLNQSEMETIIQWIKEGANEIITTGIRKISSNEKKEYYLGQNFPNPFNPKTTIEFSISNFGLTSIKIYDLAGNEVQTLLSENLVPGRYSVDWNAQNYPSGTYFYKLKSSGYEIIKKLLYLK